MMLRIGSLVLATMLSALAHAQSAYPNRPVKMIVPFAPGGASDFVARIVTPRLGKYWGW